MHLGPKTYRYLEAVWLEEVKEVKAYFLWKNNVATSAPDDCDRNYLAACEQLRKGVLDPSTKAWPTTTQPSRDYLQEQYLTNGKVDTTDAARGKKLVELKARRLSLFPLNRDSQSSNWLAAEDYVKRFYGNIIPAMIATDQAEKQRAVSTLIQVLTFIGGGWNHYRIVNCFEAALAIHSLDSQTLSECGVSIACLI